MALAEARAAWQRTANRCLVQEDAKRAPRLACCSSLPSSAKPDETGPTSATTMQDIPSSDYSPFDRCLSHPNLSPNSRWWLQQQTSYRYRMDLMDVSGQGNIGTRPISECLGDVTSHETDSWLSDQTSHDVSSLYSQCQNSITSVKSDVTDGISFEVSKNFDDVYFDSESSWVGVEKNTPWWRTADTKELALVVAQRSLDLVENCDLPTPRNSHIKKNLSSNQQSLNPDEMSTSSSVRTTVVIGSHLGLKINNSAPACLTAGSSFQKHRMLAEDQLLSPNKAIREIHKRKPEVHASDEEASKAKLLEALRHSQTRAREAEKVAKQACAEKEHVVKLLFRQASELFAYKQWIHLLQLENMYFQFRNSKNLSHFDNLTPKMRRTRKTWPKPSSRKWAKRGHRPPYDVGRYAIVFAVGLGLVGAGLLLGWTIGWVLPIW